MLLVTKMDLTKSLYITEFWYSQKLNQVLSLKVTQDPAPFVPKQNVAFNPAGIVAQLASVGKELVEYQEEDAYNDLDDGLQFVFDASQF